MKALSIDPVVLKDGVGEWWRYRERLRSMGKMPQLRWSKDTTPDMMGNFDWSEAAGDLLNGLGADERETL